MSTLRDVAVVVALALALTAPFAAGKTLLHEDEYRHGVMAREMAARGVAVAPVLHGGPYDEEPLWLWSAALATRALGQGTLALRVPGAIGLALLGAGTWLAARRLGAGARLARVAGALAIVAPLPCWEAHRALAEPLGAGLVALGAGALIAPRLDGRRAMGLLALGAAATALAALASGPRAVAQVLAPVALDALASRAIALRSPERRVALGGAAWLAATVAILVFAGPRVARGALSVTPAVALLAATALVALGERPLARTLAAWIGSVLAAVGILVALAGRGIDASWLGGPSARAGLGAVAGGLALVALRRRLPEAVVACLALAMAGIWGGVAPELRRFRAHQGISELLHLSGYRPGQVAVYKVHRESLCWHWAVSPLEPAPSVDTVAALEKFLAAAPPGDRVVIVRDKDLNGPLDLDERSDLDRKLYAEEDDYVGVTRR